MLCYNARVWRVVKVPSILGGLALAAVVIIAVSVGRAQAGNQDTPAKASATPPSDKPATTISVNVKVVNVLATIRDKHGKIVDDLTKDDFALQEDGRPQAIHYFAKETDLPLTLGLLVDTSMSQRRVLPEERSASHGFLDEMVREDKDKAFVIHFDREVELLQDLTSSHDKLEEALGQLSTPQLSRTSGGGGSSGGGYPDDDPDSGRGSGRGQGRHFGGGTLLYDAVYLASDELMKKQQGRKALVVLSDGVDRGSRETLDTAIETAQRSNTVVYSILFKDDEGSGEHRGGFGGPRMGGGMGGPMGGPGMGGPMGGGRRGGGGGGGRGSQEPRPDGKKILEKISKETGGRMFEVSKKEPIDQIYSQIQDELRHQYNLGYTPDRGGAPAAGYHKIQLTIVDKKDRKKDLIVQARDGYYAE
jgi:VWFA-related protein